MVEWGILYNLTTAVVKSWREKSEEIFFRPISATTLSIDSTLIQKQLKQCNAFGKKRKVSIRNIAKGTTDPRFTKVTFFITSSFIFRFSTKHQQQNTDQTSASKSRLNFKFKILTKP